MIKKELMLEIIRGQTGNKWPRGMGNPFRGNKIDGFNIANSAEELFKFMEESEFETVYVSVYSFTSYSIPKRDVNNAIIDCIPFDFDSDNIADALEEIRFVVKWCIRHDIIPRITFSGSKGFHLIIDFKPIELANPRKTIKKFAQKIIDGGQLKCVDKIVLGDLNRLIRIVGSKHGKTGMFCIPLTVDEVLTLTIDQIYKLAQSPRTIIPSRNIASNLVNDTLIELDKEIQVSLQTSVLSNIFVAPPFPTKCLAFEDIKENGVEQGSRDLALVGAISFLRKTGVKKSDALQILIELNRKFDPPLSFSIIRYKLGYHYDADYNPCGFFGEFSSACSRCSRCKK